MSKRKKPVDKEAVYDERINPLMEKIIDICQESKIAMVASFGIGGSFLCTTALTEGSYEPTDALLQARDAILNRAPSLFGLTITKKAAQ